MRFIGKFMTCLNSIIYSMLFFQDNAQTIGRIKIGYIYEKPPGSHGINFGSQIGPYRGLFNVFDWFN